MTTTADTATDNVAAAAEANLRSYVGFYLVNGLGERYHIESAQNVTSYPAESTELCYYLTGPGLHGGSCQVSARNMLAMVASGSIRLEAA
jgi:hypothetical protein